MEIIVTFHGWWWVAACALDLCVLRSYGMYRTPREL